MGCCVSLLGMEIDGVEGVVRGFFCDASHNIEDFLHLLNFWRL